MNISRMGNLPASGGLGSAKGCSCASSVHLVRFGFGFPVADLWRDSVVPLIIPKTNSATVSPGSSRAGRFVAAQQRILSRSFGKPRLEGLTVPVVRSKSEGLSE